MLAVQRYNGLAYTLGERQAAASMKSNREKPSYALDLCWLCGTSMLESTVCTSTFFFSSHFALVKYMKLCGKWRTALSIFSERVERGSIRRQNAAYVSDSQGKYEGR